MGSSDGTGAEIRIVHTADIHLDTCFAGSGLPAAFGNRRRQGLRDLLHELVERARTWPAHALLIAGDLFEQERVSRDTVAFLVREFASAPEVAVFISPGNQDPFVPESPYATESWPDNVIIFREPAWAGWELEQVSLTVHGFAFDGPDLSSNPFGHLHPPRDGRVHVAVGHGSARWLQPADKTAFAPFDAASAGDAGLSYLALGHFHRAQEVLREPTRAWYAGCPEGRGFAEAGRRHYLEVTIGEGGVGVTPVPCNRMVYETHEVDCSGYVIAQQVIEALRGLRHEGTGTRVARITLSGAAAPGWRGKTEAIRDAVSYEYEYLDLVDETESEEDFEALAREHTTLGSFVARINEEIADATDEARRRVLLRAREVGVAACRDRDLPIAGLQEGGQ